MGKRTEQLYADYIFSTSPFIENNESYSRFRDEINKGDNKSSFSERYVDRSVDITWLDKIEDSIIALDNIIRAPRNFIKEEEEIVPIAMSKKIVQESIKHLATHTGNIQSYDEKEDTVIPSKILNIYKEESFATYENRFIKTLLINLEIFVIKRYQGIMGQKDVKDVASTRTEQKFSVGKETIDYAMEISITSPSTGLHSAKAIKQGQQNSIERVNKLKTIVEDFMKSDFMTKLKDAALIHPPISKTNLLTKNQDYKKALELWQFIESYQSVGYEVGVVDNQQMPPLDYQDRLNEIAFFEYLLLKKYSSTEIDESLLAGIEKMDNVLNGLNGNANIPGLSEGKKLSEAAADLLRKQFRQILSSGSDKLEEIKQIFVDEVERENKAILRQEKKIAEAIKRCIDLQNKLVLQEKLRKEKAEKARLAKIEREKAKAKALAKKRAKEKEMRDKLRQKRIEEKERIKLSLALKAQKERQKKQALRDKALALKKKEQAKIKATIKG